MSAPELYQGERQGAEAARLRFAEAVIGRRHDELTLQRGIVRWLDKNLAPPARFYAIKYGWRGHGAEGRVRAYIAHSEGLRPGVWDLMILSPIGISPAGVYWCESKTRTGSLSPPQREFGDLARACGHALGIARSLDELQQLVTQWGLPLEANWRSNRVTRALAADLVSMAQSPVDAAKPDASIRRGS